jgi:hypothetical protein
MSGAVACTELYSYFWWLDAHYAISCPSMASLVKYKGLDHVIFSPFYTTNESFTMTNKVSRKITMTYI